MLILIIADQTLNDSLCCSYRYNRWLYRYIGKLYILFLTFLIIVSVIRIIEHKILWIKHKLDRTILKSSPIWFHIWQFKCRFCFPFCECVFLVKYCQNWLFLAQPHSKEKKKLKWWKPHYVQYQPVQGTNTSSLSASSQSPLAIRVGPRKISR